MGNNSIISSYQGFLWYQLYFQKCKCFSINDTSQDFEGFKNLFGKFINSTGPSVNWDKIEKLPQESVSKIAIIRYICHDLFTVNFMTNSQVDSQHLQIEPYSHLACPESKEAVKALLDQLVVIKVRSSTEQGEEFSL